MNRTLALVVSVVKRGRGCLRKTIVFGLFKRNGKVYTEIVPDVKNAVCKPLFVAEDVGSIIHSDSWEDTTGLWMLGMKSISEVQHGRVNLYEDSHINGIKKHWSFAKVRLHRLKTFTNRPSTCI